MRHYVKNNVIEAGCGHPDFSNTCPTGCGGCADCQHISLWLNGEPTTWEELKAKGLSK